MLALLEASTDRGKKKDAAGVEKGGIKDEEFTPFWNKVPLVEPVADLKVKFDDAFEAILLYCVAEKIIPTRLQTALNDYKDEWNNPERQIYDFFQN